MPLDRTWLLGVARFEREALGRTIQYTPPDRWDAPSPCEGWRARDVLAHLASESVAMASAIVHEEPAEHEEFRKHPEARGLAGIEFMDAFNSFAVAKRVETPPVHLSVEWGAGADLFLARASKLTDEDWTSGRTRWAGEDVPIWWTVHMSVVEWWIHGEDIRAAVGLPARTEHPPIFCVNDLAIRNLTRSLDRGGLAFPGKTVQIDLEGAGGGSWRRAVGRGERPDPDRRPDAFIEGRAHAFALGATGRADRETMLYEGLLLLGGDLSIADQVLAAVSIN